MYPVRLKYSVGFVGSSLFGIFTMIVYVVLIKTLIEWRKLFNTMYYRCFLLSAVLCVISYIDSWPILILPNAVCKGCTFSDFYERGTFPGLNVLRFIYAYVNHTILYLEILMVFNRYHAIAFHFQYKAFWNKYSYRLLLAVFIIPIGLTYPSIRSVSFAYYKEQFDAYAIKSDESVTRRKITAAGSMLVLTISICIFGGMTIYALYKHSIFAGRSIEVKLFLHALINALNGTFSFIYGVLTAVFPARFIGLNESNVMEYILLLNSCASPYILLLCSRQLRDRMPILSWWKTRPLSQNSSINHLPVK